MKCTRYIGARALLVGLVLSWGCGSKSSPAGGEVDASVAACTTGTDSDGDGYGAGCPAGPDCADHDPSIHAECCSAGIYAGCSCDPAVDQPVTCFDGDPAAANHAPCQKGTRTCDATSSTWGNCEGQVPPVSETCDSVDNDCDGTVDDGVLSACGNCIAGCTVAEMGDSPFPLPTDQLPAGVAQVGVDGVGLDPNGDLVLDDAAVEFHFLWVANDPQGTVSKLDTKTGREVARYASVTHATGAVVSVDGASSAAVPAWNAATNRPSRTAVDFFGDVWVANRAFSRQPSVTKIMNSVSDCTDRNGNGHIDTSSDVNGDGVISITDAAEFFAEDDECIKVTVALGTPNLAAGARAIAIDSGIDPGDPGNVWVGLFSEQAFYQLDGKTGAKLRKVPTPGLTPYGAAIDSKGRLWAPNSCCGASGLLAINTVTGTIVNGITAQTGTSGGSYGIAIDQKDRVWLGAYPHPAAIVFDPETSVWKQVTLANAAGWMSRGVGADAHGNIWVSMHRSGTDGALARINTETLQFTGAWDLTDSGMVPVGAAVDFDGNVWSVNQQTSTASRLYIDPTTKEPANHPTTGKMIDNFPTGPNPYTYSDFTGFGLRNITRSMGDYRIVQHGCADGSKARWLSVKWDATVPANTKVEVWARSGESVATMGAETLVGAYATSPADLQAAPGPVPDGKYLELTIRLISLDRTSSPVVHGYEIQWTCPNLIPG